MLNPVHEQRNRILRRCKNQCECTGECGKAHGYFRSIVGYTGVFRVCENERCTEEHMRPPLNFTGKRRVFLALLSVRTGQGWDTKAFCQACKIRYQSRTGQFFKNNNRRNRGRK